MKMLTLMGSPRKKGNTAEALRLFEEQASQFAQIQQVNVAFKNLKPCLGCWQCQTGEKGCVQKDDFNEILQQMVEADVILYASPLFSWGFSTQMKTLIDRHFNMVTGFLTGELSSKLAGKKVALLITAMGGLENNADLVQEVFRRLSEFAQTTIIGNYLIPFCPPPKGLGPAAEELVKTMVDDFSRIE